jgi:hypothetical protein
LRYSLLPSKKLSKEDCVEHQHLDAADLEHLLATDRTAKQNEQLFHLLAVCPRCREVGGWLLELRQANALPPIFGLIDAILARSRAAEEVPVACWTPSPLRYKPSLLLVSHFRAGRRRASRPGRVDSTDRERVGVRVLPARKGAALKGRLLNGRTLPSLGGPGVRMGEGPGGGRRPPTR